MSTVETSSGLVSYERIGSGPDLIMLHSLLSDRHVFDPIVGQLAERWTLSLIDLPGFGSTQLVLPHIDAYADLIGAFLETSECEASTTAVLGNGLGAFVALGTAIRHGGLFDRLILIGCGAAFPNEAKGAFRGMIEGVQAGGMEAVVEVAVRRIFTEEFLVAHPEQTADRRAVLRHTDPAAFENACRALIDLDYRNEATTVTNRTLIVTGSDDQATPPALGQDLAERIDGAQFVEMPQLAHAPQLQDPTATLAVLDSYLDRP